jgi:hypothetical protein
MSDIAQIIAKGIKDGIEQRWREQLQEIQEKISELKKFSATQQVAADLSQELELRKMKMTEVPERMMDLADGLRKRLRRPATPAEIQRAHQNGIDSVPITESIDQVLSSYKKDTEDDKLFADITRRLGRKPDPEEFSKIKRIASGNRGDRAVLAIDQAVD